MDLLYKLASRAASVGADLASVEEIAEVYDRRATNRLIKTLDEARRTAVEQLKHATGFHRHIVWLQDRFPNAETHGELAGLNAEAVELAAAIQGNLEGLGV